MFHDTCSVPRVIATIAILSGAIFLQADLRAQQAGSGSSTSGATIGLQGYCPVCIIEMKKWVRGTAEVSVAYDGKQYFFPGNDQKQMFLKNPAKYVPALGGDCTVCYAKMSQRMPGSVMHSALRKKRLYLFPGKEQQQEFLKSPAKYADVDLAMAGQCAVCRVEMGQDVPGKKEFAVYYKGFRYLFPSADQQKMFLGNPAKYATNASAPREASTRVPSSTKLVTIEGKSACAGCDHGLKPLGAPDELGLAVESADGTVYVVEQAHKLYPDVYENRFNGLSLELTGKVLKRDGNVAWIEPAKMTQLN